MHKTVEHAMCSSLKFPINTTLLLSSEIPNNTFGVFVSIKRSHKPTAPYSDDVHGCIGYWEDGKMTYKNVASQIISVAHSATWTDSRRKYFKQPIWCDPNAICEVDFMQLPTYLVNNDTGVFTKNDKPIKFDNSKYGLIAQDNKGKRATYLRYVFANKSWKYISNSLIDKASASSNSSNTQFYAYDSLILKNYYHEILFNTTYWQFIFHKTYTFLQSNYVQHVPYEVRAGRVIIDKRQCVRNVATLYDIKQLSDFLHKRDLLKNVATDTEFYATQYHTDPSKYRQCSAFIMLATNHKPLKTTIKKHLMANIANLEPNFERGEVLMALALESYKLIDQVTAIYGELLKETNIELDDVFRYNWLSKFLSAMNMSRNTHILKCAQLILTKLNTITITDKMETNYLAVMFEAYASLNNILRHTTTSIYSKLLELVYYLMARFDIQLGLFQFKDGSARLDITGHIFNGFLQLLHPSIHA